MSPRASPGFHADRRAPRRVIAVDTKPSRSSVPVLTVVSGADLVGGRKPSSSNSSTHRAASSDPEDGTTLSGRASAHARRSQARHIAANVSRFPYRCGMETTVDSTIPPGLSKVTTKRALLVASHALERAFEDVNVSGASTNGDGPPARCEVSDEGLIIGFFQRREYFDVEAARYAALAAHGHTVIVAFTGSTGTVPDGVTAVSLADDDPRAGDWVLTLVRGAFAATLSARDIHQISVSEATFQASRLFLSWSTLRRHLALGGTRAHLDHLAAQLPAAVLGRARDHIEASAILPVTRVEERLADAADHLLRSVDAGYQRAIALRLELESTQSLAERDQLTGLHNRHYLERYLGNGDGPADLLALLVDVDGLKHVNDTYGHEGRRRALTVRRRHVAVQHPSRRRPHPLGR